MQINYIILTHKSPKQLERLIAKLDDEEATFFVHIDLKTNIEQFKYLQKENVIFLEDRVDVAWGDFTIVQATLNAMKSVVARKNNGYTILLSGQDYPIKSKKEIKEYKWKNLNYFNKLKVKNYVVTFISIIALYIVLSFTFDPNDAFSYTKGIYINILIFVLFAVSLNITVGLMGQLNLGQAGFIAIGGYSAAFISQILVNYNLPTFLQLILVSLFGGLVAAVFGFLVGGSTLRLRGDYLAIITLAFGEIVKYIIQNLDFLGGATGLNNIPTILDFSNTYFIVVISIIIIAMAMTSRKGKEILSIREDEIAAENIGIGLNRVKLYGFAFSAFFAGVGGSLFAHNIGILTPDKFGFLFSIEILVMVVLGGLGSITGAIIAATILTLLNERLRDVSQFRYLVYAIILISLMIFRPKGIFGTKEFTFAGTKRRINKPSKCFINFKWSYNS